ncbi:hypothetical protein UY3_11181 [Chelonia mydas]|uniref:Uncharacterized protein n=1 Tax=Chelonia mydas TaxID=8469 RepID=M7B3L3_CHEMY|nr:hypothetical protein UY3_11181 [Chelonia mydas]
MGAVMSCQKLKNRFLQLLRVFSGTSFSRSGSSVALKDLPPKCRRRPGASERPAAKMPPKARSATGYGLDSLFRFCEQKGPGALIPVLGPCNSSTPVSSA